MGVGGVILAALGLSYARTSPRPRIELRPLHWEPEPYPPAPEVLSPTFCRGKSPHLKGSAASGPAAGALPPWRTRRRCTPPPPGGLLKLSALAARPAGTWGSAGALRHSPSPERRLRPKKKAYGTARGHSHPGGGLETVDFGMPDPLRWQQQGCELSAGPEHRPGLRAFAGFGLKI